MNKLNTSNIDYELLAAEEMIQAKKAAILIKQAISEYFEGECSADAVTSLILTFEDNVFLMSKIDQKRLRNIVLAVDNGLSHAERSHRLQGELESNIDKQREVEESLNIAREEDRWIDTLKQVLNGSTTLGRHTAQNDIDRVFKYGLEEVRHLVNSFQESKAALELFDSQYNPDGMPQSTFMSRGEENFRIRYELKAKYDSDKVKAEKITNSAIKVKAIVEGISESISKPEIAKLVEFITIFIETRKPRKEVEYGKVLEELKLLQREHSSLTKQISKIKIPDIKTLQVNKANFDSTIKVIFNIVSKIAA